MDGRPKEVTDWCFGCGQLPEDCRCRVPSYEEPKFGEWQDIADCPPGHDWWLVYCDSGTEKAHRWEWPSYDGKERWIIQETAEYDNDGAFLTGVTKFMPLPDPPGER